MAYNPEFPYDECTRQSNEPAGTPPESPYRGTSIWNVVAAVGNIIATNNEYMALEKQKPIVEQLRNSPDRVWHMDAFEKDGKYNCLRITPAGQVFLDVIKPGVHFSRVVQLAGAISPGEITTLRENIMRRPEEWQKKLEQWFLIEWETEHSAASKFDNENGWARPGTIFVADRFLDLGVFKDTQKLILRWIVKHTNPVKGWEAFKVEDILRLEWESLPTH